jgi:SAM-dependent methyltransferase
MSFTSYPSEFKAVMSDVAWHDAMYKFLQNIYRLYPEDRFHTLIKNTTLSVEGDEAIYRTVQKNLKSIKPFLADLTFALPSLFKQKREMASQTLSLLGQRKQINGYTEIGSTGRYISELRKHILLSGDLVLVNDIAPTNSAPDLMERGQIRRLGRYEALQNYLPLNLNQASMDLVTCYIGLHHIPLDRLDPFIASIAESLKVGGRFVLRDHDVKTDQMNAFVSLIHTVFNLGLGVSWETNRAELRFFRSIEEWKTILANHGLKQQGEGLLQAHDPSVNSLLLFVKE